MNKREILLRLATERNTEKSINGYVGRLLLGETRNSWELDEVLNHPNYKTEKANFLKDVEAMKITIQNEKADFANQKASGKQKLLDLGLTEKELNALIGI